LPSVKPRSMTVCEYVARTGDRGGRVSTPPGMSASPASHMVIRSVMRLHLSQGRVCAYVRSSDSEECGPPYHSRETGHPRSALCTCYHALWRPRVERASPSEPLDGTSAFASKGAYIPCVRMKCRALYKKKLLCFEKYVTKKRRNESSVPRCLARQYACRPSGGCGACGKTQA